MKAKYWLCKRKNVFFSFDAETGRRESLHTGDREEARRIIRAKNDSATQPAINISIARAWLVGTDPKLVERTWGFVIQEFCTVKKDSTRQRRARAVRSKAFNVIRNKRLVETTAEDFYAVLKSGGVFTNHILRCIHNLALGMGWILAPVIPPKLWPKVEKKHRRAITPEEHQRIIQAEQNAERKLYYELLWEIGARLESLLKMLPSIGSLFPKISTLLDKDRSAEFRRRCRLLKIEGVSLHSYRYAWAARAKQLGMPERFAQSALGPCQPRSSPRICAGRRCHLPFAGKIRGKDCPAVPRRTTDGGSNLNPDFQRQNRGFPNAPCQDPGFSLISS